MGLDNMPYDYPCKTQGVAILDENGRIDCDKTISSGMCPYNNAKNNDPMVSNLRSVSGLFGTDCWYRGKYGNYLLGRMKDFNPSFPFDDGTFYGDMPEDETTQGGMSPQLCEDVSKAMVDYMESWVQYVTTASDVKGNKEDEKRLIEDWIFATWWLRFASEYCNGSAIWY